MRKTLATLAVVLGFALPGSAAMARDKAAHVPTHRDHGLRHHGHDHRFHAMERLRRQHDLRHTYQDRRPRRHMRSM